MSTFKLLFSLTLLLLGPLANAGPKIEHWLTTSGSRVYFVESHALPIIDVQVDFAAGSAHESSGKAGVASLTRALLDLGVAEMDETAIAGRLADIGARLTGGVDSDRASVSLRSLSMPDKRVPALAILRAVLSTPQFPATVFEREKARSVAALKEALTRPETIAAKAFWSAMYPEHPYGRQASPESIDSLSRADVVAFHAANYTAERSTVTLVGDLSRAQAETVAEELTAGLPRGGATNDIALAVLPAGGERYIAHPAAQAHLLIGLPALKRGDPDFFPLVVGNYTLGGGGFVSRLMKEVRDKRGLAYSVSSHFMPLAYLGPFQLGMQTKKAQVKEALAVSRQVLAEFLAQGPSDAELLAAKQNLIGSFPLRLDSNRKLLDNVALIGFYRLPLDYLDTYQANIEKVTLDEIKSAFSRRLPAAHLVTVVVAGD
ncbi:MAG: insulinase family protein [Candidatus Accumulibacter sp.]|nr:insulinase family protein [Accumulibacter sp.]